KLDKGLVLKGTNKGYLLIIDEKIAYDSIFEELKETFAKMTEEKTTHHSLELTIHTKNRLFKEEEFQKLQHFIEEESTFKVTAATSEVIDKEEAEKWYRETSPLMVVRNVRNGQIVRSDRDII